MTTLNGVRIHLVVIAALATLTLSCEVEKEIAPAPLRPVVTHAVQAPVSSVTRSFSGVIEAAEGVDLGFEVNGRIVEMNAVDGKRYDKGELLARLDGTGYRADLNNAQAQFVAASASLQRTLRLYESQNASKSQLDSVMAQRETAKANLDIATKRLDDCTLRMPYGGAIGRVDADRQQVVSAGQTVVTIQGEGGLEMNVGVPAELVASIFTGQDGTVHLGSLPGRAINAIVTEISPQIADNATYPMKLTLINAGPEVREGMDGEARLKFPVRNVGAVLVPLSSVGGAPGGSSFVFTVQPDTDGGAAEVHRVIVRIGKLRAGAMIEVLEGVKPGDIVVSRGVNRLAEGDRVLLAKAAAI